MPVGQRAKKFLGKTPLSMPKFRMLGCKVLGMGRSSKGDRVVTTVRIAIPVWEHYYAAAAARGVPLGTYLADLMAMHVGRADLIQELTDHMELFSTGSRRGPELPPVSRCSSDIASRMVTARLMRPVWESCRKQARARRLPLAFYVGDILAVHAGRADLIQELTDPKELLPLAL